MRFLFGWFLRFVRLSSRCAGERGPAGRDLPSCGSASRFPAAGAIPGFLVSPELSGDGEPVRHSGRLRGSGKNSFPLSERPIVRKMTCVKRVPTVLCDRPSPFPERRKARNPGISFSVLLPAVRSFCFAGPLPPISCCRVDCFLPQEADMPGTGSRADVAERALRGRAVGFVSPVLYAGPCGSVRLATGRSSSPSVRVSVRTVRAQEPLSSAGFPGACGGPNFRSMRDGYFRKRFPSSEPSCSGRAVTTSSGRREMGGPPRRFRT